MRTWIKQTAAAVIGLGVLGTAAAWFLQQGTGQSVSFETANVTRGNILVRIAASGTLEPEEVVDVGARISGQIQSFGKDVDGKTVDYGSTVAQGAVIAKIDDSLYQADAAQAEAQVASAKAGVQRAEADLGQFQAKFNEAAAQWKRAQKLVAANALAEIEYITYQSAYEAAKANVAVGEAAILQAKASRTQAEKNLWRAERNLEYCTITSPVAGTVIDRRVSIGQTVAAGLNTPSLFLIAKDLKRMQVWVSVNEADIERVYPGQPVMFTVDALPDETFRGDVYRIRPNASMTQNVVTFTVEISTDNTASRLRPYLTANVRFEVNARDNVLQVPASALAWVPTTDQVAPEYRQGPAMNRSTHPGEPSADPSPSTQPSAGGSAAMTPSVLWVVQGRYVRPVPVLAGLSDGVNVEVVGQGLSENVEVVTGVRESAAEGDVGNPFTPKPPKGFKPPGGGGGPPPV
jgi:HlyD family secretion protein